MNEHIKLNYGKEIIDFKLKEDNLAWIASPKIKKMTDKKLNMKDKIKKEIKKNNLKSKIKKINKKGFNKEKKVAILVDDITRITPQKKILPVLVNILNNMGISDDKIIIIIALGTHRYMTKNEIIEKYGKNIYERVEIVNHDWKKRDNLIYISKTSSGIPIYINKIFYNCDIKIGIGGIIPHIYAGWSGGAKIIQPGISGPETTAGTHLFAVKKLFQILGKVNNPVRNEMEEIAQIVELDMMINVIIDKEENIAGITIGDPVKSHREGVKIAKSVYSIPIDKNQKLDALIISSYPGYIDLWQSTKALVAGISLLSEGGSVLLVSPCKEGLTAFHGNMLRFVDYSIEEVWDKIDRNEIKDKVAASVYLTQLKCLQRANCYIFSEQENKNEFEKIGFTYVPSISEGILKFFEQHGKNVQIGIITHGGDFTPEHE